MEKQDKWIIKRHVIADKFSLILAPVLMLIMIYLPNVAGSEIATLIFGQDSDVAMYAYLILAIVISLVALLIFERWFYPEYKGSLKPSGIGYGLKLCLPVIVFWVVWMAIQVMVGFIKVVPLTPMDFLKGLRPGFGEEAAFRGMAVALLLRRYRGEKCIWIPILLTSLFFGVTHLTNLSMAASSLEVLQTVVQTVFASFFGIIFAVIFTLSGSIWPTVILHTAYDTATFCLPHTESSPDWVTFVSVAGTAVLAIILMVVFYRKQDEATALWDDKWSGMGLIND